MSDVERRLAEQMQQKIESLILSGQPVATSSSAPSEKEATLDADTLLRTVGRLREEQRWLYGRPVRAMKVGRVELHYVREQCQPSSTSLLGTIAPPGDYCWGIPCYEVGLHSYFEPIYEDEAPTLEVLNEWLQREPKAVWGEVVAE